jgi:glycosyltransferase 2 family protein
MGHLFAATTVGFSAVLLIGRAGEIVRPVVLPMRDARIRLSASIVTVFVERIYDSLAVILLFALNLLWLQLPGRAGTDLSRIRTVGFLLLVLAVVLVLALAWFRQRSDIAVRVWQKLVGQRLFVPPRLNRAVIGLFQQLAKALRVLVDLRELAVTAMWTVLVWFGVAIGNLCVLRAFGLPFGIRETLFVLGWSMVGSVVPTPGGAAGAFHAATAGALVVLGVERETAAAVSIVMHLIDFGPAVLFGLFYFLRGDINFSRLRSLASEEVIEKASDDELVRDEVLVER